MVGKPHDIKGEGIFAFVVTKGERPTEDKESKVTKELRNLILQVKLLILLDHTVLEIKILDTQLI